MNWLQKTVASVFAIDSTPQIGGDEARKRQLYRRAFNRAYAAAAAARASLNFRDTSGSADQELSTDMRALRSRSRQLERDAGYAKRAKTIVVNNVIGSGIGLQSNIRSRSGTPKKRLNDEIEELFDSWSQAVTCHTGGELHFADLERLAMGEIFDAGEVFIRIHRRSFGGSDVPFALELIESERVPDRVTLEAGRDLRNTRMGIERDRFGRPLGYWVRVQHQNDLHFAPVDPASAQIEFVDAADMFHLRTINRWPQTRGVPWMHAASEKLNNMNAYSEAEIVAARAAANYVASIEQDDFDDPEYDRTEDDELELALEPGTIYRPLPGETMKFSNPNRPNTALDPFMRYMLREVAASLNVSYEALSRDYSQSNYSSSRLSLLEDRDNWRALQSWFIRTFRCRLHASFMQSAVFAGALPIRADDFMLNQRRLCAAKYKPRGWGWVDPQKEVKAYKEAIRAGLTTRGRVIASTGEGADVDDIDEERSLELENSRDLGLSFDVDEPEETNEPPANAVESNQSNETGEDGEDDEDGNGDGSPSRRSDIKWLRMIE